MIHFLILAMVVFTCVSAGAAYYLWNTVRSKEQEALAGRLRELRATGAVRSRSLSDLMRREQRGRFGPLGYLLGRAGPLRVLQERIDQANLKYRATDVFLLSAAIGALVFFLLGLAGLSVMVLRVGFSIPVGALPIVYVLGARRKRLRKFEEGLPDAIDLFNRSMKAGHNIHAGLESIAQETFDPIRMEFRKLNEELALGAPLEETLHGLGQRVPLLDLRFFITGLILQRQTGADLVEVLENLSLLVRERLNLAAKLKAATAQQRFSAGLLASLPMVVGLVFFLVKPDYVRLLWQDELGQKFLTYAAISEVVGLIAIRRIANPKF